MGVRYVPERWRGIIRPDPYLTFDADESGIYDSGGTRVTGISSAAPRTGIAVPAQSTDMALRASGEQTDDLDILCNRRGLPIVDEMSYLWRKDGDGATKYRGCDLPVPMSSWQPVEDTNTRINPHAVTLPDDYVVACYTAVGGATIYSRTREPDDGLWGTEVTVHTLSAGNTYPCMCVIPRVDGYRLMLYHWSQSGTQIRAHHSDDRGATWVDDGVVLREDFDTSSVTQRYRIRAAYLNGQVLLVGHVRYTDSSGDIERDRIVQWASKDGGGSFTHIVTSDGSDFDNAGAWIDLTTWRGEFVLGRLIYDSGTSSVVPAFRRLATAWYPWTSGSDDSSPSALSSAQNWGVYVNPGSPQDQYISEGEMALWTDDLQVLYCAGRHCTGADDGAHPIIRSTDGADSWTVMGDHQTYPAPGYNGSVWWNTGAPGLLFVDPDNQLTEFVGVHQRGRGIIVFNWDRAGVGQNHIGELCLGGWQTVPMPPLSQTMSPQTRVAWDATGCGTHLPSEGLWTNVTGAGASQTLTNSRVVNTGGAGTTVRDSYIFTATVAEGAIFENACEVDSGSHHVILRISDGAANDYYIEARVTSTQVTIWDLNNAGGTQFGSTITHNSQRVVIRLALNSAGGECWVRGDNSSLSTDYLLSDEDRDWTLVGASSTLVNGGGGGNNLVRMETQGLSTAYLDWWAFCAGAFAGLNLSSQPDRLKFGRNLIESPSWAGKGVKLSAVTGPAATGDEWDIEVTADYPPGAMLPTVSPSPRHVHRTTTAIGYNDHTIRWTWQRATSDENIGSIRLGVLMDGLNFGQPSIYLDYGGGYNLAATLGYWSATFARHGDSLVLTSGTGSNSAVIRRDELVGCLAEEIVGGFVTAQARVLENSPGHMDTSSGTSLPLRLLLDRDASAFTATPVLRIYPRRALLIIDLETLSTRLKAIQIRAPLESLAPGPYSPPKYPPETYYEIATFAAGPVWAFGWSPSHGRRLTTEVDVELTTAEDGTDIPYQRQPTRRELTWSWAEGVPMYDTLTQSDPGFMAAKTAGQPLAFRHDTPNEVSDQLRALKGALTPVVVVPRVDESGSGRADHWAAGSFLARIVSSADLDNVRGDEEYDEQARIQELVFREIV